VIEDALSALVHLGYGRSEAFSVVMRLQQEKPDSKLDSLIRDSLRELAA
jgi:holliday junction DNA helicase RuvA